MNLNTNIANVIDGNAEKSQYDAEAKKVLADKSILARVLKYSVKEFAEYPVELIQECIEGEPEIGIHRVIPGHAPAAIAGMNTEDAVPGEGTLTFDIRFYAMVPGGERMKLIVNVEDTARYDLLEVVMVCLGKDCVDETGKPIRGGSELHGLLGTLFSEKLRPNQKKEILNSEYGIATSVELQGGVNDMCNLSDLIEERGIEKGIEQGIERGELFKIIRLVDKKLQKGKSISQIADEVEESQEMVERISRAIAAAATDDVEEIYKKLVE